MQIGILGVNHKLAGLHLREKLARACQKHFSKTRLFHGDHTFLLLSTCNRTEVYFSSEDLSRTHSYLLGILRQEVDSNFDKNLYSFFSFDCFHHLLRVTCGLDSAIVGETEIQGQVKKAYLLESSRSKLPGDLHFLFQKALKIGKQIRSDILPYVATQNLEHTLYKIAHQYSQKKILFIGASAINLKVLHHFQSKGLDHLTLCNRTEAHAKKEQVNLLPWDQLNHWHHYDCIILATKSCDPLIHLEDLPPQTSDKLIIDLSVPRNADPKLSRDPRITLLNIDQLNQSMKLKRNQLSLLIHDAERYVDQSAIRYTNIFRMKQAQKRRNLALSFLNQV